jgi:penicillin amidase
VPFLVIGRNARVAWSFTTTGIDTQDVFVETELPGGNYATPDGPRRFETREEVIHVRGAPDVRLVVRATRHGPVISDGGKSGDPVLAVAMAQFSLGSPAPGLWALNHAASLADAGRAAAAMTAPMQNLTVADHDGIALFTTGQVPRRRAGDGSVPVPGADGLHDWTGFAGGDALPHIVDPASGTVENANERTAPPDFATFLGRDFPAPIRARRIHALLAGKERFGIADFQAMQHDDTSVLAQDLLPVLRALPRQAGLAGRAQELLAGWDGEMGQDRPEPLIFNASVQLFVSRTLADNRVPEADAGPWNGFADWLLTGAGAAWCNGDCRPALGRALADAVADLAGRYGPDPAAWRWGAAHRAVFAHPLLGDLPVVGAWASRRVAMDGDDTTLLRGGNGILGQFDAVHGAAYRGIYDLADLDRSRFVVAPGQSGNLLSAHAWDLLPLWARGDTIAIPAAPARVTATITLAPFAR